MNTHGKRPLQALKSRVNNIGDAGRGILRARASSIRNHFSEVTNRIKLRATGGISWENSRTESARHLLVTSLESSTAIRQRTKQILTSRFESAFSGSTTRAASVGDYAAKFTMSVLATDSSLDIDRWLTRLTASPATKYDKAMDLTYNATHMVGSYHRLFDGGHSLMGAIKAGHNASSDDSIIEEAVGTVSGIFKDFVTVRGIPFFTWDKDTFDSIAGMLESNLHIPKSWFYDLNTINATEVFSASIGAIALMLNWNEEDRKAFAKMIGSTALVSVIGANPILMIITLASLVKSFSDARRDGNYTEFVEGLTKGGAVTGVVIGTSSVVGGPVYVGLLAGISTGVVVNKVLNKVDGPAIRDFVVDILNATMRQAGPVDNTG